MSTAANGAKRVMALLHDIERRSRDHSQAPPRQMEQSDLWEGVMFSIAGTRYIMPMQGVTEILNYPATITMVPGTRSWVRGVANIRGTLLPIVDLRAFLDLGATPARKRNRVLVVDRGGVLTGLLVDESVSISHFSEEDRVRAPRTKAGRAVAQSPYVHSWYRVGDTATPVFDLDLLLADQSFLVAAL